MHSFAVVKRQELSGKLNATQASLSCGSAALLEKRQQCLTSPGEGPTRRCIRTHKPSLLKFTVPSNFMLCRNLPVESITELAFLLCSRHFILIQTIHFLHV